MKNLEKVTVTWFDELKGIGEGKASKERVVFLNSNIIESDGRFLTLNSGETVLCVVEKNEVGYFASKISRTTMDKISVEKSTFLEI